MEEAGLVGSVRIDQSIIVVALLLLHRRVAQHSRSSKKIVLFLCDEDFDWNVGCRYSSEVLYSIVRV